SHQWSGAMAGASDGTGSAGSGGGASRAGGVSAVGGASAVGVGRGVGSAAGGVAQAPSAMRVASSNDSGFIRFNLRHAAMEPGRHAAAVPGADTLVQASGPGVPSGLAPDASRMRAPPGPLGSGRRTPRPPGLA